MGDTPLLIMTFINPIALIMALVLMLSIAARWKQSWIPDNNVIGIMFSLALVVSMSDPIPLASGGIFDMRGLLIGTGVALLGPTVGLMTLLTGLFYRWGIGGPNVLAGFVGMFIAFGAGFAWRHTIGKKDLPFSISASTLGLAISFQFLSIFAVDQIFWYDLTVKLLPYTLVCNVVGTSLIMFLVQNEMKFLTETNDLKQAAATDHLTGLLNRRSLEDRFNRIRPNSRDNAGLAALYFDFDDFKTINDTHGHAIGDDVLRVVTNRLSKIFRAEDVFSRIGGDEFVVILPTLTEHDAEAVAERCRRTVAETAITLDGIAIMTTISIGAIWTKSTSDIEKLLNIADQALYEAKANGRNAVTFKSRPSLDRVTKIEDAA